MARAAWVALGCLVAIACTSTREAGVRDPSPPMEPGATTEPRGEDGVDLTALADRTHYSFRDLAFADSVYATNVAHDGAFTFTPAHGHPAMFTSRIEGTTSIARAIRSLADGAMEIDRGVAREQLRNTRNGLSQSWLFSERPPSASDLVVRVSVEGYGAPVVRASGLHFEDAAAKLFIHYGQGTWIEATGARTTIEPTWESGAVVLRVPHDVVAASAYPAMLDPVIGAETAVDTPITSAQGPVQSLKIAPGPNGTFLVLWSDGRPGIGHATLATRIGSDGKPIDQGVVLPIATPYYGAAADVAYDPVTSRWLVVASLDGKVSGLRIDATNGTLLDAKPFAIVGDGVTTLWGGYGVAFDGSKWLVALGGNNKSGVIDVDATGKAGTEIDLATNAYPLGIACETATCAIVLSTNNGPTLYRISKAGTPLDPSGIVVAAGSGPQPLALTSDGSQYLLVYAAYGGPLYAKRVSGAGVVLDTSPITLRPSANYSASVAWTGSRFLVVSSDQQDVGAQRIQANGTLDDATPATVTAYTGAQYGPAVAFSGTQAYVVWSDGRYPFQSAYGGRLTTALAAPDGNAGVLLSRGGNAQGSAAAVASKTGYLAAWLDQRSGQYELYAVRLSTAGTPVGSPVALTSGGGGTPVLASDGTDYLVAWGTGTSLVAKRVSGATGAVLDANPIGVSAVLPTYGLGGYSATFDGQSYVLAWGDGRYQQFEGSDVFAARISTAGALLDPNGIQLSNAVAGQGDTAVASDGTYTLVVYEDEADEGYFGGDLYGVRLDHAGKLVDASPFPIAIAGFRQGFPTVTWDGKDYLVAWTDQRRTVRGDGDIYFNRVSAAGKSSNTSGTLVASSKDHSNDSPYVVTSGDGISNFVVWTETDSQSSHARGAFLRVANDEVLDNPPIDLLPGAMGSVTNLASGGSGKALLVYERFVDTDRAERVFVKLVDSGKTAGTTCAQSGECQTRWCADAVCCTEACTDPCRKCGAGGACVPVISADDDACVGSCDATGACKKKNGDVCAVPSDCASNFCVDGFCCNTACDGECDVCNEPRGKCSPVPAGTRGTPSCSPKVCNGFDTTCPARCAKDEDCADGFGCDRPTGACVSGAVCSDEHTLRAPNGIKTDCRPYACSGGACKTTCGAVSDCAFPAACDELGRCVQPTETAGFGGCAFSARRPSDLRLAVLVALGLVVASRRRRSAS